MWTSMILIYIYGGKKIYLVSQDCFLFNDTIANNIAYGCPNASLEQVKHAAELANAGDFIEQLPDKFNTMVGENGTKLSGGQKQRIAIARAVLHNPEILILDEATSALDSATEKLVISALEQLMATRTTIIVAHRLYLAKNADQIYVLKAGKIVEQGQHKYLLSCKNYYNKLYFTSYDKNE